MIEWLLAFIATCSVITMVISIMILGKLVY